MRETEGVSEIEKNLITKSQKPGASVFVIFGAGGDLCRRKVVPALFNLYLDKNLPEQLALVGVDRVDLDDDTLRQRLKEGVNQFSRRGPSEENQWNDFARHISFFRADFSDQMAYSELAGRLRKIESQWNTQVTPIFYLATPPRLFGVIAQRLGAAGMGREQENSRIVVEKPIGSDLQSALQLNGIFKEKFNESQIFRIDHYLGKETVQNILAFRFANPLFEPIWDRRYIDHVTISVGEKIGVEHRGGYYERAGALRDMVQNHLMQLLCLIAMEPPVSFQADEVRNKKVDVLHAIRPIPKQSVHDHAVRGQYASGWTSGEHVVSYRDEPGVSSGSNTETFAALKLYVDNWRWQEVPFYLRTGKRLAGQVSEVSVCFRSVPHQSFPSEASREWQPSRMIICIQPNEGIVLKFQAKQPGREMLLRPVNMRFSYRESFKVCSPDAYETLLWDVLINDATLFMRADQVEAAWSVLMPVLEAWHNNPPTDFPNYAAGTWGPEAAQALVERDGRSWTLPTSLENEPVES